MTFASRAPFAIAAAALVTGSVQPAYAEPSAADLASARALYKEGRALRERGDLAGALEKFQAAHALGQTPITGIELARTYVQLGRLVEAEEVSLGVSRLPVASDETGRSVQARQDAAALAASLGPRLATLVVSIHGLAPGVEPHLTIDGRDVPTAAIGEPRRTDPGKHVAVLTLSSGATVRGEAQVGEGESRALVLEAGTHPPEAQPPPPPVTTTEDTAAHYYQAPRSPLLLSTGITITAIGLTTGVAFGVMTLNQRSTLDVVCQNQRCGPAHYDALDTARTNAAFSTAGFAMAGVGAALVAVDVFFRVHGSNTSDARAAHATVVPEFGAGWVGARGTF